MASKESRIREKAYHLWQEEGFPEGREMEHWDQARESVELEDKMGNATMKPPLEADGETAKTEVEPTLAVENQGEFPTLTDQGEAQAAPAFPDQPESAGTDASKKPKASPASRPRTAKAKSV